MGDGGGGHWLVRIKWRPAGWSVCLPLLIFHKVQKFSSGTGSPGWSWKKGRKVVVVLMVTINITKSENNCLSVAASFGLILFIVLYVLLAHVYVISYIFN